MAYRGNRLRFGKLTMDDTDMIPIDMDLPDPFEFISIIISTSSWLDTPRTPKTTGCASSCRVTASWGGRPQQQSVENDCSRRFLIASKGFRTKILKDDARGKHAKRIRDLCCPTVAKLQILVDNKGLPCHCFAI
jgi:hypothetical protein